MKRPIGARAFLLLFITVILFYSLVPTFTTWAPTPEERTQLGDKLPWYRRILPNKKISLGLDLQGGVHLVLGLDLKTVLDDQTKLFIKGILEDFKEQSVAAPSTEMIAAAGSDIPSVLLKFSDKLSRDKAEDLIGKRYYYAEFPGGSGNELVVRFTKAHADDVRSKAVEQAIQTIRNRIDEFGVREPSISRQGTDRISVQFPGISDPERLKSLIGQTAKLEFKFVSEKLDPAALQTKVEDAKKAGIFFVEAGKTSFSEFLKKLNEFQRGKLPEQTEIAFQRVTDPNTGETQRIPYLLESLLLITGEHLEDARVVPSQQFNEPEVSMSLTPAGAAIFAKATGENIGRRLAIVLDGTVHSAPSIRSKIPDGRAVIQMGGGRGYDQILRDAEDTALVLRAGSLPAALEFLEERTVGPSLGRDSIEQGKLALLWGTGAVLVFMVFYYGVAGLIADLAVIANLACLMGLLALFDATLTAPGLAGMVLTVGMAVDGNILIYERIREELLSRRGGVTAAVDEGFKQALSSILDSNITTLIAGIVLYQYGTGAIKGFAVTLSIGIVTTVFTVTFITRFLCDLYLRLTAGQRFNVGI